MWKKLCPLENKLVYRTDFEQNFFFSDHYRGNTFAMSTKKPARLYYMYLGQEHFFLDHGHAVSTTSILSAHIQILYIYWKKHFSGLLL